MSFFAGFDVGSSSVHYIVIGNDRQIVYSPEPLMHFADPIGAIFEAWKDVETRFGAGKIKSTAFTGSNAKYFPKVMEGLIYDFDSVTIPRGADLVYPDAQYIFHIGAKDSYFFKLKSVGGKRIIQEWMTGTKCGGGSGILIEKQCRRLLEGEVPEPDVKLGSNTSPGYRRAGIGLEEKGIGRRKVQSRLEKIFSLAESEAEKSKQPDEVLARCGVVIQSDLIHKQNEGASREDNLAGLFRTVARNYKIDVLGTQEFNSDGKGCAIVTGGVFSNDIIRRNLEDCLGITLVRPEHFHNIAAAGVALKALEERNEYVFSIEELKKVAVYSRERRKFTPSLSGYLNKVKNRESNIEEKFEKGTEVVLGIDGGSTTTKGALVDLNGRLLDKIYIKTHGNPEGSLKKVIKYLSRHKDKVVVKGVGATGSARRLYEKILISQRKAEDLRKKAVAVTDRITDEITCHALGVKHYDPQIDTIFEVGGQDMKFTCFSNDVVKEAKMNYSCQAGCGQTVENMAGVVDLDVGNFLKEYALREERV